MEETLQLDEVHVTRFRAMNTDVEVMFSSAPEEAGRIERSAKMWFLKVEQRFSRFIPDSELSRLNRSSGKWCLISDSMLEVLQLAEHYRAQTGGVFEPLILGALGEAGYNETFELVRKRENFTAADVRAGGEQRLELDSGMKAARLAPGAAVDLGGIVKSWAVKRLASWLRRKERLALGMVNAGGDLTVWGGETEPWLIGIENPREPDKEAGVLALAEGAVATSSKLGRRWRTESGMMHHLIDPRTMRPSVSDIVQCTVRGSDPVECEIWAKVLCIDDDCRARFTQEAAGYEAMLFSESGRTLFYGTGESLRHACGDVTADRGNEVQGGE